MLLYRSCGDKTAILGSESFAFYRDAIVNKSKKEQESGRKSLLSQSVQDLTGRRAALKSVGSVRGRKEGFGGMCGFQYICRYIRSTEYIEGQNGKNTRMCTTCALFLPRNEAIRARPATTILNPIHGFN